jgi:hypothetical protein
MKYIEKSWQSYRQLIPADASETQIRETRQAFYAGAAIIFKGMILLMDGDDEPSAADMARMMEIQKELDAFGQELDKRVFGRSEH